jgi:hypothetical protein
MMRLTPRVTPAAPRSAALSDNRSDSDHTLLREPQFLVVLSVCLAVPIF